MTTGPFGDFPVEEVFLPRAPLVFALTQVRFPKAPHLVARSAIDRLLAALRDDLPILREEAAAPLIVAQVGGQSIVSAAQQQSVFRFYSSDEKWKLSLTEDSISFDTSAYESRDDFLDRLARCLEPVMEVGPPVACDRVGLRYVDLIDREHLDRLADFVRPEVLGVSAIAMLPGQLVHSFTQTLVRMQDVEMQLRWGTLPADVMFDPTYPRTKDTSWVLDMDVYTTNKSEFSVEAILERERIFADSAYRFFRWATTPELINWAGGVEHE